MKKITGTHLIRALALTYSAVFAASCSPLNPSVSKDLLSNHASVANHPGGPSVSDAGGPALSSARLHVVVFSTKVLDGEDFENDLKAQAKQLQTVLLSPDEIDEDPVEKPDLSKEFSEFKFTGQTTIALDGCVPDSVVARFEVAELASNPSALSQGNFDAALLPPHDAEKSWTLSVARSVQTATKAAVLNQLQAIALTFNCNGGRLMIAPKRLSQGPSPWMTPRPPIASN